MPRAGFLDQLRLFLTALVILHHSAIMFGAPGGWYLTFPTQQLAELFAFAVLVTIDQAFFMGFFFLLSGYFSARSYDRKGALRFMRDRLLRLGIPLLIYGFVLGPMTVALAGVSRGQPFLQTWGELTQAGYFNIGPLWFALALLLFSLAYVGWRMLVPVSTVFVPRHVHLLTAALGTGTLAFLLRLWVPVGQERWMLQIGYFASYIVLFAGGCAVARSRWLEQIDAATARPWRLLAWCSAPLLFGYGVVAGALHGAPFDTAGGWTLPALAYAYWEPLVTWGIILTLLAQTRGTATVPQRKRFDWTCCAYAAYILHPPVVVGIGVLLTNVDLANSVRFAITGGAGVVLSFLLARLALKLPGAGRVL